jgi:hypothetical protein
MLLKAFVIGYWRIVICHLNRFEKKLPRRHGATELFVIYSTPLCGELCYTCGIS